MQSSLLPLPPLQSHTSQTLPSTLFANSQPFEWTHYQKSKSIFSTNQHHIVLFAYSKQKDQNSPPEIMVLQQPKKKCKIDKAKNQQLHSPTHHSIPQEKLFLKKVDPLQKVQIAEEIKHMLSVSNQLSLHDRLERRKEIFESSKARKQHQTATQEVLANRIIRVVKMDSLMEGGSIRGVVQLGAKPVQYEMLNLSQTQQEYYTLVKKLVQPDEVFPQLQLQNNQILHQISYQLEQTLHQSPQNDDQYDSNDSDNPRFDYPDEDYSERSSEGIISRQQDSDHDIYCQEQMEDEEEIYRRHLRRQKKMGVQRPYQMDLQDEYQDF